MLMRYAWMIDTDHIPDPTAPEGSYLNAKGLTGPRDAPDDLLARLAKGEGRAWKIYDDDGELYYAGRIVFADPDAENGDGLTLPEEAFGPLWDFGEGNAGATEIRYRTGGEWRTL